MKNKRFELHRKLQKQYVRKTRPHLENGIVVRHLYRDEQDTQLTWWDDTGFILNGRKISVWWAHPRHAFNDAINAKAHDNVPHPATQLTPFADSLPTYGKQGKSRKKILYYTLQPDTTRSSWYDRILEERERLIKEFPIVITPSIKIESLPWCVGVSICVPLEVRGVADLHVLCALVKRLLKQQTTLNTEFGDYKYTNKIWVQEAGVEPMGIFSHAVKG